VAPRRGFDHASPDRDARGRSFTSLQAAVRRRRAVETTLSIATVSALWVAGGLTRRHLQLLKSPAAEDDAEELVSAGIAHTRSPGARLICMVSLRRVRQSSFAFCRSDRFPANAACTPHKAVSCDKPLYVHRCGGTETKPGPTDNGRHDQAAAGPAECPASRIVCTAPGDLCTPHPHRRARPPTVPHARCSTDRSRSSSRSPALRSRARRRPAPRNTPGTARSSPPLAMPTLRREQHLCRFHAKTDSTRMSIIAVPVHDNQDPTRVPPARPSARSVAPTRSPSWPARQRPDLPHLLLAEDADTEVGDHAGQQRARRPIPSEGPASSALLLRRAPRPPARRPHRP